MLSPCSFSWSHRRYTARLSSLVLLCLLLICKLPGHECQRWTGGSFHIHLCIYLASSIFWLLEVWMLGKVLQWIVQFWRLSSTVTDYLKISMAVIQHFLLAEDLGKSFGIWQFEKFILPLNFQGPCLIEHLWDDQITSIEVPPQNLQEMCC